MPAQKRKPKIWRTEDEILHAIDRTKQSIEAVSYLLIDLHNESLKLAGELEHIRYSIMHQGLSSAEQRDLLSKEHDLNKAFTRCKNDSEKKSKTLSRLSNKTLPRLKDALAAFRTPTMKEVMGEYRGVAVR